MKNILRALGIATFGLFCSYAAAAEKAPENMDARLVYSPSSHVVISIIDEGADATVEKVIDEDGMRVANKAKEIKPEDTKWYKEAFSQEVAAIYSRLFKTPKQVSLLMGYARHFCLDFYVDGDSITYVDVGGNGLDKVIGSNGVVLSDRKRKDFKFHEKKYKEKIGKLHQALEDIITYQKFMGRN